MRAIKNLGSIHCFHVMESLPILMHHLLPLQLFLVMRTPAPAPGRSSGSMRWNCIHTLMQVTSRSSLTRTRDRKTPFLIIYSRLGTLTVLTIGNRILLICAEEVGGNFPTLHSMCTTSWWNAGVSLSLNTLKNNTSRTWTRGHPISQFLGKRWQQSSYSWSIRLN